MKHLIIIFCLLFPVVVFAQKWSAIEGRATEAVKKWQVNENGEAYYQVIVEVDSTSKKELFRRAEASIAKLYNDAKKVTEANDPEEGYILIKGLIPFSVFSLGSKVVLKAQHLLRIDVKESKVRIVITILSGSGEYVMKTNLGTVFPFIPKKKKKANLSERTTGKNFFAIHRSATEFFDSISSDIKYEVSSGSPGDDW